MHPENRLAVAALGFGSRVNGPGRRIVLWVQGCGLGCPGCFNPGSHAPAEAERSVEALAEEILRSAEGHDGLTFSGGEPFEQAPALAALATRIRAERPSLSMMAFTGFDWAELSGAAAPAGAGALLKQLDWLVAGRFVARRPGVRRWRGSANQRLWVLGRPLPAGVLDQGLEEAEIHVQPDGKVLASGFPDPALRRALSRLG